MSTASESQLECRICMASDAAENLVEPCGCKGSSRYAHYTCVQTWILTDRERTGVLLTEKQPREPVCEVCGESWRGDFKLPPPPGRKRTPEEELEVIKKAIVSAWLRVQSNIPRPHDEELLYRVAPLVDGPWKEFVKDFVQERNRREKWNRRRAAVKSFFTGGKGTSQS